MWFTGNLCASYDEVPYQKTKIGDLYQKAMRGSFFFLVGSSGLVILLKVGWGNGGWANFQEKKNKKKNPF